MIHEPSRLFMTADLEKKVDPNTATMQHPPSPHAPVEFDRLLEQELMDISNRRTRSGDAGGPVRPADVGTDANVHQAKVQHEALKKDLVGLAISGGGIRSATFSLGILQGLASFRLLGRFDYLSTVSGGGYIGS